jgi:aerotaxis receptor
MKKNFPVTGVENDFPNDMHIVSTTDLKGITTSVNADFRAISGFSDEELIGKNHNVVRHPDMPPAAFANLWETIKQNKPWMGIVKNRCKNGDHYWVDAYVTPIYENGEVTGYQSVRNKPTRNLVNTADKLYANLNKGIPFLARQRNKVRVGLMGKIYFGYLLALVPAMPILAFAPVSKLMALYIAGLSMLIGGLVAAKLVAHPWQKAAKDSQKIFDNSVAKHVYTGRFDELGQLQLVIKAQQAHINTVVWRIDSAAENLDKIAAGTETVVAQTNQAIHQQQSEIDQVATAINEMSATVHEVAQTTTTAAEAAHKADQEAKEGATVATESKDGIEKLVADVQKAAGVIKQLEKETDSIGSVLDVIRGIAEQTNLLALNAAIEAARAGEAGRGFAVVADEVRTLASRTQDSTQEIDAMIERLQTGAGDAVQAMNLAQSGAQSNAEQVELLAESLASISNAVQIINDMNTQIATAAEEQNAVAEEVSRNISNISTVAEQTSTASKETSRATEHLIQEATKLHTIVRQFGMN